MKAIPRIGGVSGRLRQIDETMPRLTEIQPGCPFNPRCPQVFDRCRREQPELMRAGSGDAACWLFGGLYLGLSLPISAPIRQNWDFTGSLSGSHAPGSWGGHAVDVVRYDANTLTIVTWGALKKMTWAFADRYCDEAYCLLSKDFLKGTHAPNGFDLDAVNADLALITHH